MAALANDPNATQWTRDLFADAKADGDPASGKGRAPPFALDPEAVLATLDERDLGFNLDGRVRLNGPQGFVWAFRVPYSSTTVDRGLEEHLLQLLPEGRVVMSLEEQPSDLEEAGTLGLGLANDVGLPVAQQDSLAWEKRSGCWLEFD